MSCVCFLEYETVSEETCWFYCYLKCSLSSYVHKRTTHDSISIRHDVVFVDDDDGYMSSFSLYQFCFLRQNFIAQRALSIINKKCKYTHLHQIEQHVHLFNQNFFLSNFCTQLFNSRHSNLASAAYGMYKHVFFLNLFILFMCMSMVY